MLWVNPRVSYQLDMPWKPQKEDAPEPPQLAPSTAKEQLLYSEFSSDAWAFHSVSKGESRHPIVEMNFGHDRNFFSHDLDPMTMERRSIGKTKALLSDSAPSSPQRSGGACTNPSVHLTLHFTLTCEQDIQILLHNLQGVNHHFPVENHWLRWWLSWWLHRIYSNCKSPLCIIKV